MKRIALFLLTNPGVMLVLGLAVNLLDLNQFLSANGLSVAASPKHVSAISHRRANARESPPRWR